MSRNHSIPDMIPDRADNGGEAAQPWDISLIINAHGEGRLAGATVMSAVRAVIAARARGLRVEMIAVLDAPSDETSGFFDEQREHFDRIEGVLYRDLGKSRNHGAEVARGDYLAFLDADDLTSENWLYAAFDLAERFDGDEVVLHPEISFYFGARTYLLPHIDFSDPEFELFNLLQHNYWTALCFVSRRFLLERNRFAPTHIDNGFGFEDWHWNCQAIAAGARHHIVPATAHFIRVKESGSLVRLTTTSQCVIHRTSLFEVPFPEPATHGGYRVERPEGGNRRIAALVRRARATAASRVHQDRMGEIVSATGSFLKSGVKRTRRAGRRVVGAIAGRRTADALFFRNRLPHWLRREWKVIRTLEPGLCYPPDIMGTLLWATIPISPIAPYYPRLDAMIGSEPDHVVLLGRNAVPEIVEEQMTEGMTGNVVCIVTETLSDDARHRLPGEWRVVEFGATFSAYDVNDQRALLLRVLLQKRPKTLRVAGSQLGDALLASHRAALATVSAITLVEPAPQERAVRGGV